MLVSHKLPLRSFSTCLQRIRVGVDTMESLVCSSTTDNFVCYYFRGLMEGVVMQCNATAIRDLHNHALQGSRGAVFIPEQSL